MSRLSLLRSMPGKNRNVSPRIWMVLGFSTIASLGLFLSGCQSSSPSASGGSAPVQSGSSTTDTWRISAAGLGPVHLGMSIQQVKSLVGTGVQVGQPTPLSNRWVQVSFSQRLPLFSLLYPAGATINDTTPSSAIAVMSSQYRTDQGIGPGSTLAEAMAAYGQATLFYNLDQDPQEFVRFANVPNNLYFLTFGHVDSFRGNYPNSNSNYNETQSFDPKEPIYYLIIQGDTSNAVSNNSTSNSNANGNSTGGTVTPSPSSSPSQAPAAGNTIPAASPSSALSACQNATSTANLDQCNDAARAKVDQNLNQVYQQVAARLPSGAAEQLASVEKTWLAFRDAQCQHIGGAVQGGSLYASTVSGCFTSMTEKRIATLQKDFLNDRTYSEIGTVSVNGQIINCHNPQATPEYTYCSQAAYAQSDRDLNSVYQDLQKSLNETRKVQLTNIQLQWIDYRDRQCDFATREAQGGTGYETYRNNCLTDLTQERIQELKAQLDFESL